MDIRTIGERIEDARQEKRWSQSDLAEEMNKYRERRFPDAKKRNDDAIGRWERNKTKDLNAKDVESLSKVLGMTCDELILGVKPEDRTAADELHLSGNAIVTLKIDDEAAEIASFFLDNNQYLHVLKLMKEYIQTPDEHKKIEGEELYVNLADIRMVNIENELRKHRRDFIAEKKVRRIPRKDKGGSENG